jgi:hypothetical protein
MLHSARQVPSDQALAASVRQKDAQHPGARADVGRTDVPAAGDNERCEAGWRQVAETETLVSHERLQEAQVVGVVAGERCWADCFDAGDVAGCCM